MEQISDQIQSIASSKTFLCTLHNQRQVYLYLGEEMRGKSLLKCPKCVTQERIQTQYLLSFDELLNCNEESFLDNLPLHEKNYYFEQIYNSSLTNFELVQSFFKEFRCQIMKKIDGIQEKVFSQFDILEQTRQLLIPYYNKISFKSQIKEQFMKLSTDYNNSMGKIKDYLKEINSQKKNTLKNVEHIYQCYNYYHDYLSVESLSQYSQGIYQSLDNLQLVSNYQILNLLQKKNGEVSVLPQTEQFNKKVYFYQKQILYSIPQISNRSSKVFVNNHLYSSEQICTCDQCTQYNNYHKTKNQSSFQNLTELHLIQ